MKIPLTLDASVFPTTTDALGEGVERSFVSIPMSLSQISLTP